MLKGEPELILHFLSETDVPLTAGLADSDIFTTPVTDGYSGSASNQVSAEKYGCFLIELNALRVAECIILSPLFERGKAARFWKKFL